MKKLILLALLLSFALSLTACNDSTTLVEISCEDIIKAYEDAGYYVTHGHNDEIEGSHLCYIKADLTQEPNSDYIYFTIYFTEEQAEEARKANKYNLIIWLYAAINGETRWLKSEAYGKIEYSYYNSKLIKPFNELIQQKQV